MSLTDPMGLWALQIGLGGGVTFPWGGSITLGFGLAFDGNGNVAVYEAYGAGAGIGAGETAGGTVQYSANAQSIDDLLGLFNNVSVGGGAGFGGTLDAFTGTTDNGQVVTGGGFTIGEGAGVTSFDGITNTLIQPLMSQPPVTQLPAAEPPSMPPQPPGKQCP